MIRVNFSSVKFLANQKTGCWIDKAEYTATQVACRWAGAVIKMVKKAFGQEQ